MKSIEGIEKVQLEWAAAVVAVGRLADDRKACEAAAGDAVDRLYAFDISEVLFKPTKAVSVPFRKTRRGAISYFIGGDPKYPEDLGFAMNPWTSIRFENHVHHVMGDRACVMGHYYFTDPAGSVLQVEYTFGYIILPDGSLQICLHHSSMPFNSCTGGNLMTFEKRECRQGQLAIVTSLPSRIEDAGDFLDVMASGASEVLVLREEHLAPGFFDLKTGILGEVLQKVSNYRRQLAIVGDWSKVESKAMQDFIRESNRGRQVVFVTDIDSGIRALGC